MTALHMLACHRASQFGDRISRCPWLEWTTSAKAQRPQDPGAGNRRSGLRYSGPLRAHYARESGQARPGTEVVVETMKESEFVETWRVDSNRELFAKPRQHELGLREVGIPAKQRGEGLAGLWEIIGLDQHLREGHVGACEVRPR